MQFKIARNCKSVRRQREDPGKRLHSIVQVIRIREKQGWSYYVILK